jgi:hypothetical protein
MILRGAVIRTLTWRRQALRASKRVMRSRGILVPKERAKCGSGAEVL